MCKGNVKIKLLHFHSSKKKIIIIVRDNFYPTTIRYLHAFIIMLLSIMKLCYGCRPVSPLPPQNSRLKMVLLGFYCFLFLAFKSKIDLDSLNYWLSDKLNCVSEVFS